MLETEEMQVKTVTDCTPQDSETSLGGRGWVTSRAHVGRSPCTAGKGLPQLLKVGSSATHCVASRIYLRDAQSPSHMGPRRHAQRYKHHGIIYNKEKLEVIQTPVRRMGE